jgi:hypothetical protein
MMTWPVPRTLSPLPACGERSDREAVRVRGRIRETEHLETPPHPNPLPAQRGEMG